MLDIKTLKKISKMNLISLCNEAGLKSNTVRTKIKRQSELKVNESLALENALLKFGLKINEVENE